MTLTHLSALATDAAPALANHLWQSTAFAATVWLLTLLLRNNHARIRYTLWLAASIKFLIPFSLLITLGTLLPKPQHIAPPTTIYSAIDTATQPFPQVTLPIAPAPRAPNLKERLTAELPAILATIWLTGAFTVLLIWYKRWQQVHTTLKKAIPLTKGRELEILRRLQRQSNPHKQITLLHSQELMEPGIFGIFRPTLLWPARLSDQLEDQHIEAILVHESIHVQRQDNLTAALHMLVEAIFWFHPIVWWMETRMIEERERACDEAVVQQGGNPETYAESLLKACRFCMESPLPCVCGITGSDLNKRIVSIMTSRLEKLGTLQKLMFMLFGLGTFLSPLALGMLHAFPAYGQVLYTSNPLPSFEVATIKPLPNGPPATPPAQGGSTVHLFFTPKMMVMYAYNLPDFSEGQILKGAGWMNDNYEVQGKISDSDYADMQKMPSAQRQEQIQLMLQSLLMDRLKLKVHLEKRQETVYALEVAKTGVKLAPTQDGAPKRFGVTNNGQTYELKANGVDLDVLAQLLGREPEIGGRSVVNKTGLTGSYFVAMHWTRTGSEAAVTDDGSTPNENAPSYFTAIQEQLGLKLVATKAPVEVLVIDHIEQPTGDAGGEAPPTPTQAAANATTKTDGKMAFEVISIRRNNALSGPVRFAQTPDGFYSIGLSMFAIFQVAYAPSEGGPLRGDRIVEAPDWLSNERYDVVAKVDQADLADWQKPQLKQAMLRTMLQAMLAERCEVTVHHESKEVPVYNLVVAKGGPKFKPAETADLDELKRKHPDGGRVTGGGLAVRGPNGTQFYGISMAWLAQTALPTVAGRPVVDKTGLTDRYDFTLPSAAEPPQPNAPPPDDESVFTALPQALGLRLEPAKGQIETLVIDHVERPTEN
jgi:bla regulator protein blaR1